MINFVEVVEIALFLAKESFHVDYYVSARWIHSSVL